MCMGSEPLLTSLLLEGVTTYLDAASRWFVGYEMLTIEGKVVRRAVRFSVSDIRTLVAGGSLSGEGAGDPPASVRTPVDATGLEMVGMDNLSRLSADATLKSVYVLGYQEVRGKATSYVMSLASFVAYLQR